MRSFRLVAALFVSLVFTSFASAEGYTKTLPLVRLKPGQPVDVDPTYALPPSWNDATITVTPPEGITVTFADGKTTLTSDGKTEGYSLIPFIATKDDKKREFVIAAETRAVKSTTLMYKGKPGQEVFAAGSFNGWNNANAAWQLKDDDNDGTYRGDFEIASGTHMYKFVIDGEWVADASNPKVEPGGHGNSVLDVGGISPSLSQVFAVLQSNKNLATTPPSRALTIKLLADGKPLPKLGDVKAMATIGNIPVTAKYDADEATIRIILSDWGPLPFRVRLLMSGLRATPTASEPSVWRDAYDFIIPGSTGDVDWHDTVMYFAIADRFLDGDMSNNSPVDDDEILPLANWMGGDFAGITQKLKVEGYFEQLGVNTLWLSPLFQQAAGAWTDAVAPHLKFTAYHGYWPADPRAIEPRFGGEEGLQELIDAAHAQNKRVLVDFVAKHVHQDHPWFKDHPEWFGTVDLPDGRKNLRLFDEFPLTTWFDTFLPAMDYEKSAEAVSESVAQARYLIEEFGVDGFRQDAVKHIPWVYWRAMTRDLYANVEQETGRRAYQVGETISGRGLIMDYVGPDLLDAQFDFPLTWAIRDSLAFNSAGLDAMNKSLLESLNDYGEAHLMVNFVGNHDFSRFISFADGDVPRDGDEKKIGREENVVVDKAESYRRLELGVLFVFTIPGIPMLYYGDEYGLAGAGDPDNRRMMQFGDDLTPREQTQLAKTKQIGRMRREFPVLWTGSYLPLHESTNTLAYLRSDGIDHVVVVLNKGKTSATISLANPLLQAPVQFKGIYVSEPTPSDFAPGDLPSDEVVFPKTPITLSDKSTDITIPAMSGLVYHATVNASPIESAPAKKDDNETTETK